MWETHDSPVRGVSVGATLGTNSTLDPGYRQGREAAPSADDDMDGFDVDEVFAGQSAFSGRVLDFDEHESQTSSNGTATTITRQLNKRSLKEEADLEEDIEMEATDVESEAEDVPSALQASASIQRRKMPAPRQLSKTQSLPSHIFSNTSF